MKKPKSIKVFYNGARMKDVYPHATWFQVIKYKSLVFLRKVFIVIGCASLIYSAYLIGTLRTPDEIIIEKTSIEYVQTHYPVMERIAKCESSTGHFKNGQVVLNANKNGTVDVGKYQINIRVWGKIATEMGYNLMNEEDNEAFAMWIYRTKGTEDWYSSKHCWR